MQATIHRLPATRAAVIGRNIALEMAEAMLELGEGVTRDDLKLKRFTDGQIDRYANDARAIADKRSSRRVR